MLHFFFLFFQQFQSIIQQNKFASINTRIRTGIFSAIFFYMAVYAFDNHI